MNKPAKIDHPLAKLREPFPAHQISKLPKPTKKQTEDVRADFKKGIRCQVCGSWHHPDVIHLDYVGHAALTDRLLDVDPEWTWEPMGTTPEGLPVMNGGLWIKLTVCGVSRYGYGAADGKSGGDAVKEMIGDALRNAAMRFGAALDLWHKGDLHSDTPQHDPQTGEIIDDQPESPDRKQKLIGTYDTIPKLETAGKEFVRTLNSIGDLDEFEEWEKSADVVDFLDQLQRDMPDWWRGGPSMPPEFVPLEIRIAQKRRDLEQIDELRNRERTVLDAG